MSFTRPWSIHHFETLTSTMDQARILAQSGAPDRTAITAREQTQGRGRNTRSWQSRPGAGLYCTLVLRPGVISERLPALPLLIGVAAAQTIELITNRRALLKWPNDVWLESDSAPGKVAGILITSSLRGVEIEYVLVGIGINVAATEEQLPMGGTSILLATGVRISVDELLRKLLVEVDDVYARFLEARGRPSLDTFRDRAAMLGELVAIDQMGTRLEGRYLDVDDDGALLLERSDHTTHRILAGDLVRGPRPARKMSDVGNGSLTPGSTNLSR